MSQSHRAGSVFSTPRQISVRSRPTWSRWLVQVLANLPDRMRPHLDNLDNLLAMQQVSRGNEILATLDAEVVLQPAGDHFERGNLWQFGAGVHAGGY